MYKKTKMQQVILNVSRILFARINVSLILTNSPVGLWWYDFKYYLLIYYGHTQIATT